MEREGVRNRLVSDYVLDSQDMETKMLATCL